MDTGRRRRLDRDLWAPDFLQLAGPAPAGSSFECSTTRGGVTGALCVIGSTLTLSESDSTIRLGARDVRGWWDTAAGDQTFSLDVEADAHHSVILMSEFRSATVHAMTRAFGPAAPLDRLSA